jgi:nicotinate-nucleotide adenylyltransferase
MERIGVLGGTFNPVHLGHIHLALEFCDRLALSRVLLIPTQSPPHKHEDWLAPAEQRLEMCRIAASALPRIEVSDIEIKRGGTSYTVDTLRALSAQEGDARLFFIMGADMFLTLENWKSFDEIARLADLCATARRDGELHDLEDYARSLEARYGARCHIESISVVEVSSTRIREAVSRGEDAGGLLPAGVYEFIRANRLYEGAAAGRQHEALNMEL